MDHHTASQCDPLYATREFDWNHEWAQRICGHLPLPRLVWPSDVVGTVYGGGGRGDRRSRRHPGGRGHGGRVLRGVLGRRAASRRPDADVRLDDVPGAGHRRVLQRPDAVDHRRRRTRTPCALAAGTSTAGSLIGWLQSVTGGAPFDDLMAEAQRVPPGSEGLLVLPYFAGERTPVFDPQARGVVAGLTLRHSRGHLFRAAYEGISFGIRQILERFDDAHSAPGRSRSAADCAARSGRRAVSDITGRPQLIPGAGDRRELRRRAARGDRCRPGAAGNGLGEDRDGEIKPDPRQREHCYDDLYATVAGAVPGDREQVHRLAAAERTGRSAHRVAAVERDVDAVDHARRRPRPARPRRRTPRCGTAKRPRGIRASIGAALASSPHTRWPISVSTTVGQTELARIPCGPSSGRAPWSP